MPFRNETEDLFEESRMSFGEHLEELRVVLIRSLIGIAIGCVFGFIFAERVVTILQQPLEQALTKFYVNDAKNELRKEHGYVAPEWLEMLDGKQRIPDQVLVEPSAVVSALRKIDPNFMSDFLISSYQFRSEQFQPREVIQACGDWSTLNTRDPEEQARWKFLWSLLEKSDQEQVIRIGSHDQLHTEDLQQFVQLLNRLLKNDELYRHEAFQSLIQDPDPKKSWLKALDMGQPNVLIDMKNHLDTLDDKTADADLVARLNRALITASFPNAIVETGPQMAELTFWKPAQFKAQSLGATDPFMIWLKAGVVTGLLFASPWVFFQLWSFVAAGLYPTEQRYVYVFLPVSLALFFSGVLLAFFFVFEPVLDFLFSFNARMGIAPQPRINDWLSFVMFLPLGFGVAFQLPLVMLFANRIELVTVEAYLTKWRIAVVVIFGISMVLTPADPVSMIMLAVPLTGLYFLGIFLCRWLNKPTNPFAESVTRRGSRHQDSATEENT